MALQPFSSILDTITPQELSSSGLTSLSGIVSAFLNLVLPLAGLILLIIIIISGFTILTGANNPEQVEKGKHTLTYGLIGFVLIFAAYWIGQILEVITGFPIVNP